MKFTITGSTGNISKPLTQKLVALGHEVTVVSSNNARQAEIESLGAKAAIGSINDASFLTQAFTGADAVYAMTPPNLGGSEVIANTIAAGEALAQAIKAAGIKRVVMLSSVGADLAEGNGPIKGLHHIEKIYNELSEVAITYLRAGYFYTNFYNDIPMIKGMNTMGGNFAKDTLVPLVHPTDIATAAAHELQQAATGHRIKYVVSDVKTVSELASAIGEAIGQPHLSWTDFSEAQAIAGMLQAGLPEEIAHLYAEMGSGFRSGRIQKDFIQQQAPVIGEVKLDDFAQEFAQKF